MVVIVTMHKIDWQRRPLECHPAEDVRQGHRGRNLHITCAICTYGDIEFVTVPLASWSKTAGILFTATFTMISIPVPLAISAMGRETLDLYDPSYACHAACNFWNAIMFAASGPSLSHLLGLAPLDLASIRPSLVCMDIAHTHTQRKTEEYGGRVYKRGPGPR